MLTQEEKEYKEFIKKFLHTVSDLKKDFEQLSENNKERVRENILSSAQTQIQFEILHSIVKRL